MTEKPFTAAALRGAVDLSALARPAGGVAGTSRASSAPAGGSGQAGTQAGAPAAGQLVITGTDATFQAVAESSVRVPVVMVLWSSRLEQSADFVEVMARVARSQQGRFQLVEVDVDTNPGLLRAFQLQSVPAVFGLVQGQPVPLFVGIVDETEAGQWVDQLLQLAAQHGVTGRVEVGPQDGSGGDGDLGADDQTEPELPALHQQAFDAIESGDLDAAVSAYEQALKENPADADASLGLAQVRLLKRTEGADLQAARAAAAANPDDVAAQCLAADLDLSGGHVDDAFGRLIDTVRRTAGAERDQARAHLLELFELVGPSDPRVLTARKQLTMALF